jgi:phage repressor protein C with HTH and peptisase S24 domain
MLHTEIWRAIDSLAATRGLSPSGLAKAAGLDPTTFNRSKRFGPDGRPRWPSTESVARALEACDATLDDLAAMLSATGRAVPVVGMARAGEDGFFDPSGFPVGATETVRFPDVHAGQVYALEIAGDSMSPLYREGDIVIVQPNASVRRGDRVVVRTREGEVLAKELGRRTDQVVELLSINPAHPPRMLASAEVAWISRIIWASQ